MLREGCALCRPCPGAVPSAPPAPSQRAPLPPGFPTRRGCPGPWAQGALGILLRGARPPLRGGGEGLGARRREGGAGRQALGWCAAPARPAATAPVRSDAAAQLISMHAGPRARPRRPAPSGPPPRGPPPPHPTPPGGVQGLARALGARTGWGGAGPRVPGTQTKGVPAGAAGRSARTISPHAPSPNLTSGSRILGSECLVKAV